MIRFILRLSLIWAVGEALFSLKLGEESTLYWELDYAAGLSEHLSPYIYINLIFNF